jgi:hypothetical protein
MEMSEMKKNLREDLKKVIRKYEDTLSGEKIIELRRFMFYNLLEKFGSWKETGDCIPKMIQVGAYNPSLIEITIRKE